MRMPPETNPLSPETKEGVNDHDPTRLRNSVIEGAAALLMHQNPEAAAKLLQQLKPSLGDTLYFLELLSRAPNNERILGLLLLTSYRNTFKSGQEGTIYAPLELIDKEVPLQEKLKILLTSLIPDPERALEFYTRWQDPVERLNMLGSVKWSPKHEADLWLQLLFEMGKEIPLFHVTRGGVRLPWNTLKSLAGGHTAGVGELWENGVSLLQKGELASTMEVYGQDPKWRKRLISLLTSTLAGRPLSNQALWEFTYPYGATYPYLLDKYGIHFSAEVPLSAYGAEWPIVVVSTPTTLREGQLTGISLALDTSHNDVLFVPKEGRISLDNQLVLIPEDYEVGDNGSLFLTDESGKVIIREDHKQLLQLLNQGEYNELKEKLLSEGYPEWLINKSMAYWAQATSPMDSTQLPIFWQIHPPHNRRSLQEYLKEQDPTIDTKRILWFKTYGRDPWKALQDVVNRRIQGYRYSQRYPGLEPLTTTEYANAKLFTHLADIKQDPGIQEAVFAKVDDILRESIRV